MTQEQELKVIRIPISIPDDKGGDKQVTTTEEGNKWNGYMIPTTMIELDPNSPHDSACESGNRCLVRGPSDEMPWHVERWKNRWQEEPEDMAGEVRLHWIIVNKVAPDKYRVIDNERIYLLAKSAGIPYLYCIVEDNIDDYEVARIQAQMNATHAIMPFRTWSERDEVRFLTKWFKEFVRRRIKQEPPQTFEEFTTTAPEFQEKRQQWINRYANEFALMNQQRLYTLLYLGYRGHCLDCTMKDLELDYIKDNKRFPATRRDSDKDDLVIYAMQKIGAKA